MKALLSAAQRRSINLKGAKCGKPADLLPDLLKCQRLVGHRGLHICEVQNRRSDGRIAAKWPEAAPQ